MSDAIIPGGPFNYFLECLSANGFAGYLEGLELLILHLANEWFIYAVAKACVLTNS